MDHRPAETYAAASQLTREGILVFDGAGEVLFASGEVAAMMDRPIHTEVDLENALALSHGTALGAAEQTGGRPTERPLESGPIVHRPVRLTVHAIELAADGGAPVRLVIARDATAARESAAAREAFAQIVAHELRTPITTIYGGAQLVTDPSISEAARDEALRAVAAEAERLYRTVEDLVLLARFDELRDLGDTPILVQRLLPPAIASEARHYPTVRFETHLPDDLPAVRGRTGYVEQVVRHLLSNAARFGPPGSPVVLTAEARGDAVEIRVEDGGPAIAENEAQTMFDLFARTQRAAADASGANLSLFVSRRVIEAMGGTIQALTTERSTVVVTLGVFPEDG